MMQKGWRKIRKEPRFMLERERERERENILFPLTYSRLKGV